MDAVSFIEQTTTLSEKSEIFIESSNGHFHVVNAKWFLPASTFTNI